MYRNLLKKCRNLRLNSFNVIRYSSNVQPDDVYEKYYNKIQYSSFLEDSLVKLGYTRNKISENRVQKAENHEALMQAKIKPFPIALKYMYGENIDPAPDIQKADADDDIIVFPYRNIEPVPPELEEDAPNHSNWMQDYEIYDESENDQPSLYGTPDPNAAISNIPCGGCGALLHCADTSLPGYLPSELFKEMSVPQLKTTVCQRCHFLKNYNTAINVTVSPEHYIEMISTIKDKFALAIVMVDLFDFPCSIWPGLVDILGGKRPIIVVGNKVDLLPKDSSRYLHNIKESLTASILKCGFDKTNLKHVSLISAKTGYGVEELITKLHNIWGRKGDVYLVGCTNVGKSSLFNALLRSDFCKAEASNLVQRATACPWPGTTLRLLKFPILTPSDFKLFQRVQRLQSESVQERNEAKLRRDQARETGKIEHATLIGHIGSTFGNKAEPVRDAFSVSHDGGFDVPILTLNEKNPRYINSRWCYDTPGVVQTEQILNLLTTEELLLTIPKTMIRARTYIFKTGMTLFLAGLGRLDYLDGIPTIRVIVYASSELPILICNTLDAEELYKEFLGTDVLRVPRGNKERFEKWPALESSDPINLIGEEKFISCSDILLSSAGWISINMPAFKEGTFRAWTPEKRGIVVRQPALLPNGLALRGRRIRNSLAYRLGKAFVKE